MRRRLALGKLWCRPEHVLRFVSAAAAGYGRMYRHGGGKHQGPRMRHLLPTAEAPNLPGTASSIMHGVNV